jgi:hypothetical protein
VIWSTTFWIAKTVIAVVNLVVYGIYERQSGNQFTEGFWCAVRALIHPLINQAKGVGGISLRSWHHLPSAPRPFLFRIQQTHRRRTRISTIIRP